MFTFHCLFFATKFQALAEGDPFDYFGAVSNVEEIERAVERLAPEDLAKLAAWMDRHRTKAGQPASGSETTGDAEWFKIYMDCPHAFEIPPRTKQFYKPKP